MLTQLIMAVIEVTMNSSLFDRAVHALHLSIAYNQRSKATMESSTSVSGDPLFNWLFSLVREAAPLAVAGDQ